MTAPVVVAETGGMPRDEWLALRRGGIGGSDAAAIAGLNPYRTAIDVWLDKTGQITDEPGDEAAERMRWGNVLEPVVAAEWSERHGIEIVDRPVLYRHPDHDWMLANIDRETVDPEGILEVKTAGINATLRTWNDPDDPPDYVYVQALHYLAVTGRRVAFVAVLLAGQRLASYTIERDDTAVANLLKIEEEFWQHVADGTMPPVDGAEHTTELLQAMYDVDPADVRVLPPGAESLIKAYETWRTHEKEAAERKREAGNRLRQLLGPAEVGMLDGQKAVTWKAPKGFDDELFKLHEPDLAAEYRTESVDRRRLRADHPEVYDTYTLPGAGPRRLNIVKRSDT